MLQYLADIATRSFVGDFVVRRIGQRTGLCRSLGKPQDDHFRHFAAPRQWVGCDAPISFGPRRPVKFNLRAAFETAGATDASVIW